MEIKVISMVSFEMESETDLSNRKKVVLAQVTPQIFFSVSEQEYQRENSSKPLKHSIVERILVLKRLI